MLTSLRHGIWALILLNTALSRTAEAQSPAYTVFGTVTDSTGAVIEGLSIKLRPKPAGPAVTVISDTNGAFLFDYVAPGDYELSCVRGGFAAFSQQIAVSSVEPRPLRIILQPETPKYSVTVSARPEPYTGNMAASTMRVDTPLIEIPQSIQVINHVVLEERQTIRVADAAEVVADVSRTIGFSESGDRYMIRGFLIDYSLRDGFKNNSWTSMTDVGSVDHVEVLKGPAGIIYGKVEPGGVVNVVTKRALPDWHIALESVFDSFGSARPSLDLNGPLIAGGKLQWRVNAAFDSAESQRDFVHSRTPFVAPALTWNIGKKTTFSVQGEFMRLRGVPDVGLPNDPIAFTLPVERSIGEPNDSYRNDNKRLSYFFTPRFSEHWTLSHAASYLGISSVRAAITLAFPGTTIGGPGAMPLVDSHGNARRDWEQLNDATRDYGGHTDLVGKFSFGPIQNTVLAGFELQRNPQKIGWVYFFNSPFGGYTIPTINLYHPDYSSFPSVCHEGGVAYTTPAAYTSFLQREKSDGVYLQDQIAYRKVQVVLGGRADIAASDRQISGFGGARIKDSFDHFSPHLGFVYRVVPTVSFYASYSQSFTYLPFNPIYFRLASPLGANQTHGIQYEGGLKLDIWRSRLQATASYFYLDKDRMPLIANGGILKTAKQLSRGVELDLTAEFRRNWNAIIAYAFDDVGYAYGRASPDINLVPIWNAPLHSGNIWTTYALRREHLPRLTFGAGANYRDRRYFSVFSNLQIPVFTRLDGMVAWQSRENHWRLQFNVKDLTNHRYFETDAVTMYLYPHSRMLQAALRYQF